MQAADGPHAAILSLQRTAGNRAVSKLVAQSNASLARAPDLDKMRAAARDKVAEPLARGKARELINKAKQVEPRVTRVVQSLAFSRRGKMKGLEYRLKSEESLARKLRDKALASDKDPATAIQAEAATIRDALRYTIILAPDQSYGHLFGEISESMKLFNYKADLRKDYWLKGKTYKGINLTFLTDDAPPVGFEVQLHTEASFDTKQLNHHEYEEEREAATTPKRRAELNEIMAERWVPVAVPEGFTPPEGRFRAGFIPPPGVRARR